ncbi:hypothetical protein Hypma_004539 [Hypsizygus marmoreus]|uniref:Uncharacterized protein n=1 Tax=Hypsizygus marmoreus TaxID=39966 RepID=A0A369K166_HYPMA|nr:hypothetical protein Hypma_004539 [Hypsizygus marmoreus]
MQPHSSRTCRRRRLMGTAQPSDRQTAEPIDDVSALAALSSETPILPSPLLTSTQLDWWEHLRVRVLGNTQSKSLTHPRHWGTIRRRRRRMFVHQILFAALSSETSAMLLHLLLVDDDVKNSVLGAALSSTHLLKTRVLSHDLYAIEDFSFQTSLSCSTPSRSLSRLPYSSKTSSLSSEYQLHPTLSNRQWWQ